MGSASVSILMNNGDGTFAPGVAYGTGDGSFSLAVGDLDGDLDMDIARAGGNVSILLNDGDGIFAEEATYDVGDTFDHQASVGFIQIYGLPVRTQAEVQGEAE